MKIICLFFGLLLLNACVSVNYIPHVVKITQKHHAIAVLPPKVTLERKIWMSDDRYNELTAKKQFELQAHLIRLMMRRINEGKCFVEVLDINTTNDIALPAGYNEGKISPKELCKRLKVDAVIESNFQILEPVSEATALFFQQATNTTLITNSISLNASLIDTVANTPIWNLSTMKNGTLGSIKELMINKVIRRATRNTPYNIKKEPYRKMYLDYLKVEGDPMQ